MDKTTRKVYKKYIVQAIIKKIEEQNRDTRVKTNLVEGYNRPERILKKSNNDEGYIPDVISEKDGRKDLYEVELSEQEYILEKWRLFSMYSMKAKGSFNLVVPEEQLENIKNLLKENKISARIIYYS